MSPILVRPVREQLEHDRLVRLLQVKSRRRYDAAINPGAEQNTPLKSGTSVVFPDVLLFSPDRGRRLQGIIEVETGESVNHLEALAQWATFAKLRVPFILYVPASMADVARRLCEDNQIQVSEFWSYHHLGDEFRFTLMHRARESGASVRAAARAVNGATNGGAKNGGKPAAKNGVKTAVKTVTQKSPAKGVTKSVAKTAGASSTTGRAKSVTSKSARPKVASRAAKAVKPVRTAKKASRTAKPARKARPQKRR